MLVEKKIPGYMNGDDDPKLFDDKAWLNAMNCRMGVTEYGRNGRWENVPGTTLISQSAYPPYGNQLCLGGCIDNENNWLIYVLWNSFSDHGIYCLDYSDPSSPVVYPVLYDSQTTDGLGLSKNYRIDRNCRVINGVFYWTDNLAQPRKVNVRAGINLNRPGTFPDAPQYAGGIDENIITIIRKPPDYTLTATKVEQTSPVVNTNFITLFAGKFAAFYDFIDNEKSVLSAYSELINYNFKSDTYNAVDLVMSFGEIIPQDVQRVNYAVQFGNDPNFFTIKTWDKNNATDVAEIAAHNAGSTALTYRFFNDQTGAALGSAYSVKPFDSVPLLSKTIETVKDRLFLGNNTEGYTTPTTTSLSASFATQSSGASYTANVFKLTLSNGVIRYLIDIQTGSPTGYYRVTADDTVPPADPVAFAALTFVGAGATDVFKYYIPAWPIPPPSVSSFAYYGTTTVTGISNPLLNITAYKSGSPYKTGVVFYDRWMRKCGIVINGQTYTTEDRVYALTTYTTSLDWVLSNSNAVNEIPDWAEYYAVVRTKCLRTTYFLQARSKNIYGSTYYSMTYVEKNTTDVYVFTQPNYSPTLAGVGIDITNLTNFGMGYTFADGDLIKIYKGSDVFTLRVLAQDGRWLVCELQDLSTLNGNTDALFEIYTPYLPSINEAYYEVGEMYAINNPGESNRTYSVLADSIPGDITLLERDLSPNNYITENMSPNDTYWMNWFTDAGRPNFIDYIGQVQKPNSISYSNTYIPGTRTNGLSSFDALDEANTPQEAGSIQKLQVASKITELGNVMLTITTNNVISIYMGEEQLVGASANAFIAQSSNVIGTMNVLKKNWGTQNPETVVEIDGLIFGYDIANGIVWQYADNGLVDVGGYKQTRFYKSYAKDYEFTNPNNLDNINGFHHIPTGIDYFHKELVVTLPGLIYSNYADVLPSYGGVVPSYATSIINRFDIYDQLAKTMTFSYEQNKWGSNFEFKPEFYLTLNDTMFGFKNGNVYSFYTNTTNWNTFFGTEYPLRLCPTGNLNASLVKDLFNIAIESNVAPDYTVALTTYPNEQITDLASDDFTDQEGVFYAPFFRDRLSPNISGTATHKMFYGDILKDYVVFVMMEFQQYDNLIYINFANIGYDGSRGQKQIAKTINT